MSWGKSAGDQFSLTPQGSPEQKLHYHASPGSAVTHREAGIAPALWVAVSYWQPTLTTAGKAGVGGHPVRASTAASSHVGKTRARTKRLGDVKGGIRVRDRKWAGHSGARLCFS